MIDLIISFRQSYTSYQKNTPLYYNFTVTLVNHFEEQFFK